MIPEIYRMKPSEREQTLRELAEKNESPWIPCYDTSQAGEGHLIMMLFDGKEYRYQIACWEPLHGFFPKVWGLSEPILNNDDYAGYKPDDGRIEKFLEESGYYKCLFEGLKTWKDVFK